MVGKREMSEDVYGMVLQRLRDTVRAGLPKPFEMSIEIRAQVAGRLRGDAYLVG